MLILNVIKYITATNAYLLIFLSFSSVIILIPFQKKRDIQYTKQLDMILDSGYPIYVDNYVMREMHWILQIWYRKLVIGFADSIPHYSTFFGILFQTQLVKIFDSFNDKRYRIILNILVGI